MVLVAGTLAYARLVALLRVSGKRTLAKLNAFDFVATIALGSVLASIVLATVPVVDGIAALTVLIGLQFVVAWSSTRWLFVGGLVKSVPTPLLEDGTIIAVNLIRARVPTSDVAAAVRASGYGSACTTALETPKSEH